MVCQHQCFSFWISQYCVSCPHLSRVLWPWAAVVIFSRPGVHLLPLRWAPHGHSIPTPRPWTLQWSCSPLSARKRGNCWRPWPSGVTLSVRLSSPCRRRAGRAPSRSVRREGDILQGFTVTPKLGFKQGSKPNAGILFTDSVTERHALNLTPVQWSLLTDLRLYLTSDVLYVLTNKIHLSMNMKLKIKYNVTV